MACLDALFNVISYLVTSGTSKNIGSLPVWDQLAAFVQSLYMKKCRNSNIPYNLSDLAAEILSLMVSATNADIVNEIR